ncbi:MAG TPA: FAD-binding oxidoreductase [Acetobacteraceae bacterium]|nr:FAD-binding oxidoreductase [Acetobacteraceae bacterium]
MSATLVETLQAALGAGAVLAGEAIEPRYLHDWGIPDACAMPLAVTCPRNAAEVAAVLLACSEARVPVVPQGGMTGLAGGATPSAGCVALSLERMRAIEEIDVASATMTVQAGATLQSVQEAAEAADLFFALDIGGRGSCLIGGNVSTNAGGNRVLRYGMARALVLGIEVVLADGTIVTSLNKMLKNNAGYDLKQMFIGAEGTLGVITRLVLRLHPRPRSVCTALCALAGYEQVLQLLACTQAHLGGELAAFEVMWPDFYRLGTDALGRRAPLAHGCAYYVLLEQMGTDQARDEPHFSALIEGAVDDGIVENAVVAQSVAQSREIWAIRDSTGEFPRTFWPLLNFDVSIPIGEIGGFVEACSAQLAARWPEIRTVFFGHIADSNVHIVLNMGDAVLPAHEVEPLVYDCVRDWRGSISAEHGIGVLKREYLGHSRSEAEIAVMRRIKAALDPLGILNPGKVI